MDFGKINIEPKLNSKLRIKLYFSDESPLFWTQIDYSKIRTIQDLTEEIGMKHQSKIKSKTFQLLLEDAILPPEESVTILGNSTFCTRVHYPCNFLKYFQNQFFFS